MGNGQLHSMPQPQPPSQAAAGEDQPAEADAKQHDQPPRPGRAEPSASPPSTVLPAIASSPSAADASDKPHIASTTLASAVPEQSATALLPSLTPRARALPALVRAPSSPSADNRSSLSPRPSSSAAKATSPSPSPPTAHAVLPSSLPSSDEEAATRDSLSSSASSGSADSALAASTIVLSPPSPTSAAASNTAPPMSSPPATSSSALSPVVSPSARASWQLDSGEHRSLICRFCGGATCKHEDYTRQPNYRTAAAVVGLNSSYITPNLIAMQRPSTQLIRTHSIAQQFQSLNVTALINCQQTGEHALCGGGIAAHGFSYHPDDLPHTHHYSFGWVDMGTPPIERMLNITQVMHSHEQRGGRVAVHCHAGYGRTGMVIACYLVFAHHYSADMAITTVRQKREGSVQTREQKRFCFRFEQYIKHLRYQYHITPTSSTTAATASLPAVSPPSTSFTTLSAPNNGRAAVLPPLSPPGASQPFQPLSPTPALPPSLSFPLQPHSLSSILTNQRLFLHGHERQQFRYVSKLVSLLAAALDTQHERLCEEIEQRAATLPANSARGGRGSFLLHLPFDCTASWTLEDSSTLDRVKHGANLNDYSALATASPFILLVALLHFLAGLAQPVLPFYAHSLALPASLSTCFPQIARASVPTVDAVVRLLHGLQFVALVRSSDARPVSTFVVLAFAFALLHPHCATPPSLAMLIPDTGRSAQPPAKRRDEEAKADGDGGAEEAGRRRDEEEEAEGASLGSMLCFMSVLLTEWHEEHGEWTKREDEERQSRRIGTTKGERWWLGQDALSPRSAGPDAALGAGSTDAAARGSRPASRRNSGKRSARSSRSKRSPRKQKTASAEADSGRVVQTEQAAQADSKQSAAEPGVKVAEEESKEQAAGAVGEGATVQPLATARGAKRGSGTRPILPPLILKRTSSRTDSAPDGDCVATS